jgi:peptidyl-tRNA hydrolase
MSVPKAIDQIVEAFIPEMEKISKTKESEEQKERHYKAWLRATLQKFAADVRDIELSKTAEDSPSGVA